MPVDFGLELRLSYLRAAQNAIENEEAKIILYRDFYDGDHSIKLTDRQKEYLRETFDSFGNICKRVVAIPGDRLSIAEDGIEPVNNESTAYAEQATLWWSDVTDTDEGNDLDAYAQQGDIYQAALRDGAVAIIVGWDDEIARPTFTPNLLYDGGTGLIRFHYDSDNKLLFASKRWTTWDPLNPGETGKRRLTVYRPGLIDRYESDNRVPGGWRVLMPEEIDPDNPVPNPQPWTDDGTFSGKPLGIPVIPFDNPVGSELQDVISIQELLNHNLGTFDISVDFHGYPLLWFSGFDFPIDSGTGKTIIPDMGPGQALNSMIENGRAGRIEPADLKSMFESGIMSWVQVLALVKGWPMWMFDRGQEAPSGVALQMMERSLVNQVKQKQISFSGSWRKAFNMARKLHKLKMGKELGGQIIFNWRSAETQDELLIMETKEKKFSAGQVPIIQRWRELGYDPTEIEQMLLDAEQADNFGMTGAVNVEQ